MTAFIFFGLFLIIPADGDNFDLIRLPGKTDKPSSFGLQHASSIHASSILADSVHIRTRPSEKKQQIDFCIVAESIATSTSVRAGGE